MAWNENPIVDANSKRCEASENATRNIFTKKRGFQNREEKPDYGVDFVVELIYENQMSGFFFAIQLKSKEKFKQVELNQLHYFSFQFQTSRLGYMCRRTPGFGLIIIYNETTELLHYDYIEAIVDRLDVERTDGEWRENSQVNIHIPIENILDAAAAMSIFTKMKARHGKYNNMYANNAQKHDLPITSAEKGLKEEALYKEFEYMGGLLINSRRHDLVYKYISKLNRQQILTSKNILYYALLSYFELGYFIDAQFYLKHCFKKIDMYGDDEKEALRILKPKIEFLLGDMEFNDFIDKLQLIVSNLTFSNYRLNVQMDILNYETTHLNNSNFNQFQTKIQSVDAEIDRLEEEHVRVEFKLQLHQVIQNVVTKKFSELMIDILLRVEEQLPIHTKDIHLRKVSVIELVALNAKIINQAITFALSSKNKLLNAEAVLRNNSFILQIEFYSYVCRFSPIQSYSASIGEKYLHSYEGFLWSANVFIEAKRFKQAQLSIGAALELQELVEHIYPNNADIFQPKNQLLNKMQKIDSETNMNSYIFNIKNYLRQDNKPILQQNKVNNRNLNDNQIQRLALNILNSNNLPNQYLPNIILEIKGYQKFTTICKNKNLELRTKGLFAPRYAYQPVFAVISLKTNLELGCNSDIDLLIKNIENLMN